jgi:ADP-ribosylglycohydrolase
MSFRDRAIGSFLGLALGDAFGRPLEPLQGAAVRALPVDVSGDRFDWADATHMALYLASAILEQAPDRLDENVFAKSVGKAFCRWLADPSTASAAAGAGCLKGVGTWCRTRDWHTSGVPDSDGSGAVMRIAPLGVAFAGAELDRTAFISAKLTHGHPNAAEAAVAACRLLRAVLVRGRLDSALVEQTAAGLESGSMVAAALRAAIRQATEPLNGWLDERAIPSGDGGWRAPSALGLAVAAALRWGEDFSVAVEKSARIDGNSQSVAALTGMFLGAAGGTAVLPPGWCAGVRSREMLETLARSLAVRGEPWVAVSDLHGRADRLQAVVDWADRRMTGWRLALLGNYVDHGPDVPELLDAIVRLKAERGDGTVVIAGNHDCVCSRALETLEAGDDDAHRFWAGEWRRGYWNPLGDTPSSYGAMPGDIAGLARRIPPAHRRLLADLPWFHDTGRWLFVHAGLAAGQIGPQLAHLSERDARPGRYRENGLDRGLPPHLCGHSLDDVADVRWDRVVVSAHSARRRPPGWEGPNRIALRATDRPGDDVYAVLLPDRVYLRLCPGGDAVPV